MTRQHIVFLTGAGISAESGLLPHLAFDHYDIMQDATVLYKTKCRFTEKAVTI